MLPGFRFLFAAIVLSVSLLVFGLGAAALLRATHEEFASAPAWRTLPEPKFAQRNETPAEPLVPVLAVLRVEPGPAEPQAADDAPPAEPAAITPAPDQPEETAVLKPLDGTPPDAEKFETTVPETPVPETPVAGEALASTPAPAEEAGIATAPVFPAADETVAPAPERATAASAPDAPIAELPATQTATLADPPVAIEKPPAAKAASAKPGRSATRKRRQARHARERRRQAQRARQAAMAQQQTFDPFAQPTVTNRR